MLDRSQIFIWEYVGENKEFNKFVQHPFTRETRKICKLFSNEVKPADLASCRLKPNFYFYNIITGQVLKKHSGRNHSVN